jgi:hypothetical protein
MAASAANSVVQPRTSPISRRSKVVEVKPGSSFLEANVAEPVHWAPATQRERVPRIDRVFSQWDESLLSGSLLDAVESLTALPRIP